MTSVFNSEHSDPRMQAAINQARQTFKILWRELSWEYRRIVPALQLAAVKLPFTTDGNLSGGPTVEEMWISNIQFDGEQVSGTLMNQPQDIIGLNEGEAIERTIGDLTDWMYVIDGRMFGAFTVQVIRSNMSNAERKNHDQAWGIDFCDPERVRLHPHATLEAEETSTKAKKSFLGKVFGGKDKTKDQHSDSVINIRALDDLTTLDEHPMSVKAVEKFKEHLRENPSWATDTDDNGWTQLQHEALAGNLGQVEALLTIGADPALKNPNGHSAIDLANVLGWTKISDLMSSTKH